MATDLETDDLGGKGAKAENAGKDLLFNQSVEKAFAILRAFGSQRRAMTLAEMAAATGVTKSAAQRSAHTLEILGFIRKDAFTKRWVLTPKTLDLAYAYLAGNSLVEHATPHLLDLNHACGETVNLSEPDGNDMVFVARFPSHKRFFIHMPVGRRLPMYCTASGRAFLSVLPEEEALRHVENAAIQRFTPHTVTDHGRILELVREAREHGYAWSDQECYRGDLNIAAAILGAHGRPVGAINISGPTSRWTLEDLRLQLAPLLMETARAISGMSRTLEPT